MYTCTTKAFWWLQLQICVSGERRNLLKLAEGKVGLRSVHTCRNWGDVRLGAPHPRGEISPFDGLVPFPTALPLPPLHTLDCLDCFPSFKENISSNPAFWKITTCQERGEGVKPFHPPPPPQLALKFMHSLTTL